MSQTEWENPHYKNYPRECPKHCPTCHKYNRRDKITPVCPIRHDEWLNGINTIISQKRKPGEGQRMAEELIHFMKNEFMQQAQDKEDSVPF